MTESNPVGGPIVGFLLVVWSGISTVWGDFMFTAFCLTLLVVLTLGWYAIQGWGA